MKKFTDFVFDREGNCVVGAEVYVKKQSDETLKTLYSDNGVTGTANPCVTDNDGKFEFYTSDDTIYIEVYVDGVLEQTVSQIQHYDDLDNEVAALRSVTSAADKGFYFTGSGTGGTYDLTAFGRTLGGSADAAAGRTSLGLGTIATFDEATTAQVLANTADKALSTDQTWAAADYIALTDAATVAVDMSLGINFSLTIGDNRTLGAPTNTKNGQAGEIIITQDGTGSRTLAYHANWKFAGGVDPTLSTAAGAVDVLSYKVVNSTFIIAALNKAFG
jgi:hypothetical protein